MSKKIVSGCLGVFLLLVVIIAVLVYSFLYVPIRRAHATLGTIQQANERIENQEEYDIPQGGFLDAAQVQRFISVQERISSELEPKMADMKQKYETLGKELEGRDPKLREIFRAWHDVLQLFADAKHIQVDALNAEGFSLGEYRFVRQAFYLALGLDLLPYSIDAIAQAAKDRELSMEFDKFKLDSEIFTEEALESNRELVSQYSERAEDWLVYAFWGL